jgi:hypothetical protein
MRCGEGAFESDGSWFFEEVCSCGRWVFSSVVFISGGFETFQTSLNGLPRESA